MLTYCPSCGTNVPIEVVASAGRRVWRCPNCTLAFKEELLTPGAVAAAPPPPPPMTRAPALDRMPTARPPLGRVPSNPPGASPSMVASTGGSSKLPPLGRVPTGMPPGSSAVATTGGDSKLPWGDSARKPTGLPTPGNASAAAAQNGIPLGVTPEEPFIIHAQGESRVIPTGQHKAASVPTGHPPAPAAPPPVSPPIAAAYLTTPSRPAPAAAAAPAGAAGPTTASPPMPGRPFTLDELLEPPPPLEAVFPSVIIAEDSALLREVLKDSLVQYGVSREVLTCATGEEVLQAMAGRVGANLRTDLILIDVEMPVLNGYLTAIALRAFERGLRAAPTPIVFFTARACDETFRKVLEYCQPARYLNKGTDAAPPRVATRLVQVLASLRR